MRQAVKRIEIKGRVIGGGAVQICLPIVGRSSVEIVREAEAALMLRPDLVEWRADYFEGADKPEQLADTLGQLREVLCDYPLIFTCRAAEEGGAREISPSERRKIFQQVLNSAVVDMVDVEAAAAAVAVPVIEQAKRCGVKVIVSSHDFQGTPPVEKIVAQLVRAQEMGADLVKIAVMPTGARDVLRLLDAALTFKERYARVPLAAISMAGPGVISRAGGFLFGSDLTFAAGERASAPGQIAIADLRNIMETLRRSL